MSWGWHGPERAGRWPAAVIGAVLLAHALAKAPGHLAEMMWLCHVGSALTAAGFLLGARRLLAAGVLLHVSWGVPGYLLDAWVAGGSTLTSALAHLLPVGLGLAALARLGWPAGVVWPAWVFYFAWVPLTRLATPARLNVNFAHAPWPPVARYFPDLWVFWAANGLAVLAAFHAVDRLMRARLPLGVRREAHG